MLKQMLEYVFVDVGIDAILHCRAKLYCLVCSANIWFQFISISVQCDGSQRPSLLKVGSLSDRRKRSAGSPLLRIAMLVVFERAHVTPIPMPLDSYRERWCLTIWGHGCRDRMNALKSAGNRRLRSDLWERWRF